jgi:hypothetical protein
MSSRESWSQTVETRYEQPTQNQAIFIYQAERCQVERPKILADENGT